MRMNDSINVSEMQFTTTIAVTTVTNAFNSTSNNATFNNDYEESVSLWETTIMPITFTFEVIITFYIFNVLLLEEIRNCRVEKSRIRRKDPHRIFRYTA